MAEEIKQAVATLDVRGKKCPEPNMMIKAKLDTMAPGDILEVVGDAENRRSVERFIKGRGHNVIEAVTEGDIFHIKLEKSSTERGDVPVSTCKLK